MKIDQKYYITRKELGSICKGIMYGIEDNTLDKVYYNLKSFKTSVEDNVINKDEAHKLQLEYWLGNNISKDRDNSQLAQSIFNKSKEYRTIEDSFVDDYKNKVNHDDSYTLVKAAKQNITAETVKILQQDNLTENEIDQHLEQLTKVEDAFFAKREASISNMMYYTLPLSYICPTLGLISASAAGASVFLSPLLILMNSFVFTYNNIKKDGLNTTENKLLILGTLVAGIACVAAIAGFAGAILPFGGALIFPVATTISFALFCYGSTLEEKRNVEAIDLLKVKIQSLVEQLSVCNSKLAKNPQDKLEQKKLNLIEKNINILLYEYTNIVRTIKFPVTKNDHITLLNETRLELTKSSLQNLILHKGISYNTEYNKNIYEKVSLLLPTKENRQKMFELEQDLNDFTADSNLGIEMSSKRTKDLEIKGLTLMVLKRARFELFKSNNEPNRNKIDQLMLLSRLMNDLDNDATREKAKITLQKILPIIGDTQGVDTIINEKLDIMSPSSIKSNINKKIENNGVAANSAFLMQYMENKASELDTALLEQQQPRLNLHAYVLDVKKAAYTSSKLIMSDLKNKDSIVNSVNETKNHVMSYFIRDTTYYTFNMALMVTTTLIAMAPVLGLPIVMSPPVMIGIAVTIATFMLITSTQWYMSKDKIATAKERLAPDLVSKGDSIGSSFFSPKNTKVAEITNRHNNNKDHSVEMTPTERKPRI